MLGRPTTPLPKVSHALLLVVGPQAPRLVPLLEGGQYVLVLLRLLSLLETEELVWHLLQAELRGCTLETVVEGLQ